MTTQQQTEIRIAASEMVLRISELRGGEADVTDTEDLIECASNLYVFLTTGRNVYVPLKTKNSE
jgi:hypothetical protein